MTDVALKEYMDRRIDDLERRVSDRFESMHLAITKADAALETRLNGMNEFRDALRDQSNRMVTRLEHDKLDDRLRAQENARANLDGRILVISVVAGGAASLLLQALLKLL